MDALHLSSAEMDRIARLWTQGTHDFPPDASIVIPAYNEEVALQRTIRAVAQAVFACGTKAELVVVNNASTDDTAGVAQRLGAIVAHEPHKGLSYARQTGVLNAASPVILSTDADTTVGSDWTKSHLRHYDRKKVVGVVGGHRFEGAHPLMTAYKASAYVVQSVSAALGYGSNGHWSGCNTSYRRESVLEVGGYEPGFDLGEDWLISHKLSEVGEMRFDPSQPITVTTSGRRFDTAAKVFAEARTKILALVRGKLYLHSTEGRSFEDIR